MILKTGFVDLCRTRFDAVFTVVSGKEVEGVTVFSCGFSRGFSRAPKSMVNSASTRSKVNALGITELDSNLRVFVNHRFVAGSWANHEAGLTMRKHCDWRSLRSRQSQRYQNCR